MVIALFLFYWLHLCLQAQSRTAALNSDLFTNRRMHACLVAHSKASPFFISCIVVMGVEPKLHLIPQVLEVYA